MTIIEIAGTDSITGINQLVVCTAAGATVLTLARSALGKMCGYYIKNIGTGTVTVTPQLNDFIDSAATRDLKQYESIYIIDYKLNNWIILSDNHV